ncbi:MAG: hypothetical protein S4CHLAM102_04870 [Chlamydiia bacterium]|nr:hypothetical protein [Chlamydiia bacterium]
MVVVKAGFNLFCSDGAALHFNSNFFIGEGDIRDAINLLMPIFNLGLIVFQVGFAQGCDNGFMLFADHMDEYTNCLCYYLTRRQIHRIL